MSWTLGPGLDLLPLPRERRRIKSTWSAQVKRSLIGCLSFGLSLGAAAQSNSWIEPTSSFWHVPTRWSLGVPPDVTQGAVLITNANSKTVSLDSTTATNTSTLTISNLIISAAASETNTLEINMGSPSATLTVLNSLSVGSGGAVTVSNSALTVSGIPDGRFDVDGDVAVLADGMVLGSTVYLGKGTGSYGVVSMTGGSLACRDRLLVGGNGAGAVWEDSGQLIATNILTAIGFLGPGQMTISNGVALAGDLAVGCYTQVVSTAADALTVAGGQLVQNGNYTMIGCSGLGQMTVTGGTVDVNSLLCIAIDKGTGTVWVVDGQLAVTNGDTLVGSSGSGNVILSNGTFRANSVYVGSDPFLFSVREVTGSVVTGIVSGGISEGTLTAAGGTMMVRSNLLVGVDVAATGTVWATGGEITATNDTTAIGYSGVGRMTVSNGTVGTRGLYVGQLGGSRGTLTMAGGTLRGTTVYLGAGTGSYGVVSLNGGSMTCRDRLLVGGNGTGEIWQTDGQLIVTNILTAVGFLGPGQLTLSSGTMLAGDLAVGCYTQGVSTAANALTVAGGQLAANGDYTMIGCSGAGQMTVAGGTANLASLLSIGIDKGTGAVWVVGGQLTMTNDDTCVGCSGSGQMTVSNGIVRANTVYVGNDPFAISDLLYTNAPVSQMVSSGVSAGTLTVAGGSVAIQSNLVVGAYVGATGAVWVTGGQMIATNDTTAVGYSSIGRMTVSNGTVETLGMFVGRLGDSQGTLTVAGGTLISWGDVVVGDCATNATGQIVVNGGDLFVINASHNAVLEVKQGTLTVNSGLLFVDTLVATNPCAQIIHNGGWLIYDNLVLDPNGDNDGDGMPNGWEQAYGLDPLNAADANADADGDGFSNLQEYQAGTDPTNNASALRITDLEPDDADMLITWTAVGGKRYVLQTTTGDSGSFSNNFVDLNPAIVAPGTGETEVAVLHLGAATNAPARFYRVRLLTPP